MIATLTLQERRIGLGLSVAIAMLGLAMAAAARTGPMAVHGGMALILGLVPVFPVLGHGTWHARNAIGGESE